MSTLYITEFQGIAPDNLGTVPQAAKQPGTDQTPITISGVAAASQAFAGATRLVRIHSDVVCSIAFGKAPTATTANARLAANQTEYFVVNPGDKVSVVSNT